MDVPLCHGGFAEVWKGEHQGREVAVKVLRVYVTSNLVQITKVGLLQSFEEHIMTGYR